jgi:hypothetical protein
MTFPLLAVSFLGGFYTFLVVAIVRRATKPSCRNCLYWHECCLNAQLGRSGRASESCMTNRSEL